VLKQFALPILASDAASVAKHSPLNRMACFQRVVFLTAALVSLREAIAGLDQDCEASSSADGVADATCMMQAQVDVIPAAKSAAVAEQKPSLDLLEESANLDNANPDPKTGIWSAEESKAYWGNRDASNAEDSACPCMKEALHQVMTRRGYKSAADFGAGMGGYALFLKRVGVKEVHCFDGNQVVVQSSGGLCKVMDLGKLQAEVPQVDMAYSLEVGEHIPKEFESNFIDNLVKSAKRGIFLSWAIPGQGGTGHFNEQSPEYIISEIEKRGFVFDSTTSYEIRKKAWDCRDFWWFERDVSVFVRA